MNNNHSKIEKLSQLTTKIPKFENKLSDETINTSKYSKYDARINELQNNLNFQMESLDNKFNKLRDELFKLTEIYVEDENYENQIEKNEDVKFLEIKFKNMLEEERINIQKYTDNVCNKLEFEISKFKKKNSKNLEIIKFSLESLKQTLDIQIENLNSNREADNEEKINIIQNLYIIFLNYIDNETKIREESESCFVLSIEELMHKFHEEFLKEKNERKQFEENIFQLLEETYAKIASRDESD